MANPTGYSICCACQLCTSGSYGQEQDMVVVNGTGRYAQVTGVAVNYLTQADLKTFVFG